MPMINEAKEIDTQDYIQYILKNGTHLEKREFLQCLDGQLYLKGGEVWLEDMKAWEVAAHTNR